MQDNKLYEMVVLFRPELEADMSKISKVVEELIAENGGSIDDMAEWGRRELAYKIAGETHALYRLYRLSLPSSAPAKIDATLNITDGVIRHLITKVDTKVEKYLAEQAERKVNQTKAEGSAE